MSPGPFKVERYLERYVTFRIKPAQAATKRPSYMDGLDYIALNDEPTEMDRDQIAGLPSVHLLAALFGMEACNVAFDVMRIRALHKGQSEQVQP